MGFSQLFYYTDILEMPNLFKTSKSELIYTNINTHK